MRLSAEILTIGNEVLKGFTLNTNAQFLGTELTQLGFLVSHQSSCADNIAAIKNELKTATARSHVTVITGGLGPTPDDLTRDAVTEFFQVPLVIANSQLNLIKKIYRQRKKKMPASVKKEAMFPRGAFPLVNHYGIALGFWMRVSNGLLVVLPGVPSELRSMFTELVRPLLRKEFPQVSRKPSFVIKMTGISEPDIVRRLSDDFFRIPHEFGIYPDFSEVAIRVRTDIKSDLQRLRKIAIRKLRNFIFSEMEESLSSAVGKLLLKKKLRLAVAESCSGGLLSSEIIHEAGASQYFQGAIIAYDNSVKTSRLGVPQALLTRFGAVSKEVAGAMATGVRVGLTADIGVSITGIAGPGGGQKRKPVGLVYIGISAGSKVTVYNESFFGDRLQVRQKAAKKALQLLWFHLVHSS